MCIAGGAQSSNRGLHSKPGWAPFNVSAAPHMAQTAPTIIFSNRISIVLSSIAANLRPDILAEIHVLFHPRLLRVGLGYAIF
jgi:hypothetical protein